jgi:hypothetical protein
MSKKVAVPLMLLSLGIFAVTQTSGCSSSNGNGGSGGAKADGGTGGKTDAGTGGRIDAGGTGGATGTGGRIDAGPDATGTGGMGTGGRIDAGPDMPADVPPADVPADLPASDVPADLPASDVPMDRPASDVPTDRPLTDAPTDASFIATTCAMQRFMLNGDGTALSPADFCTIYLSVCNIGGRDASTPTRASCEAAYSATSGADGGAYGNNGACKSVHVCNAYNTGMTAVHCPHAEGAAICSP